MSAGRIQEVYMRLCPPKLPYAVFIVPGPLQENQLDKTVEAVDKMPTTVMRSAFM